MVASIKPENVTSGPGAASRRKSFKSGELHIVRDDLAGLVAHDLRTPLAAISMNLDFVLGELPVETAEAVRAALEDCRGANARAVRIVSDMADAVQLAAGERRATVAEIDPCAVLASVVEGVAPEVSAREVRLSCKAEGGAVQADVYLFTRALERVVERALWHARGGGKVDLALTKGVLTVQVSPPPPGGAEGARSLGTHFAQAAMRAQGGSLAIESDDQHLVFRMTLPL
jgi:signal transduction histidine kinase